VSGLAALLLAHHPDFRGRFAQRDAARVDRLFELIKGSCRPLPFGDPGRSGAGLPDAVTALGPLEYSAPAGESPEPATTTLTAPSEDPLEPLRVAMRAAGLLAPADDGATVRQPPYAGG
jgi:hypothetical protein